MTNCFELVEMQFWKSYSSQINWISFKLRKRGKFLWNAPKINNFYMNNMLGSFFFFAVVKFPISKLAVSNFYMSGTNVYQQASNLHCLINTSIHFYLHSCRTVAVWKIFVDRPESYSSTHSKKLYIYCAEKVLQLLLTLFKGVVHVQQGEMIAVNVGKSHLGLVSGFLHFRGSYKTLWD